MLISFLKFNLGNSLPTFFFPVSFRNLEFPYLTFIALLAIGNSNL